MGRGLWPHRASGLVGQQGDQLLTTVKGNMKYKLDVEVRGHILTRIVGREQQCGLKSQVMLLFSFHVLIVFLCMFN